MRTVKIQGGLGNQLFGLAFAHSIASVTGERVGLDLASYGADRYGRSFDLRDMAERLDAFAPAHAPWRASRAASWLARRLPVPGMAPEGAAPPSRAALEAFARRPAYFDGYWQNEAFIAEPAAFATAVRAEIARRGRPADGADVVIHFRTYREEVRADRGATPAPDYFRRCLAELVSRGARVGAVRLISDDPALAMLRIGDIGAPVAPLTGGSPWDDMATLMAAPRLILTNSSFSWWGGYCGVAQTVFYPRREGLFHYPAPAARFEVM